MSKRRAGYTPQDLPETAGLEAELKRVMYRRNYRGTLRSTVYTLITVSAVAVLVAVLLLPVLRIYGSSMNPTLNEKEIVVSLKGSNFHTGDIVAFYYNNKILVKRVIANPGDWVDIDEKGVVYVNKQALDEPYVQEKALGDCDIELPFQVPEDHYFVMGDDRPISVDSRHESIGAVAVDQIIGKIMCWLWPLDKIGTVE